MLETEDPRAALAAKDVKTRASGARDLARIGTWDDVEGLVRIAIGDKSTSMRLCAAAAAADILARHRASRDLEPLDEARCDDVLRWVSGGDPSGNPSVLMVLSAVPSRRVIERLGRLLRDPRSDVRMAAATSLGRMALSHTALGDPRLREAIGGWLRSSRHPPDAKLELIALVGRVGWTEMERDLLAVDGAGTRYGPVVQDAVDRLRARLRPESWHGLYRSDGYDVMEIEDPTGRSVSSMWVGGGIAVFDDDPPVPVELDAGQARIGLRRARLVWAHRQGEPEVHAALQLDGVTAWRAPVETLSAEIEAVWERLRPEHAALIADVVAGLSDEDPKAPRAGALAALGVGDLAEARRHLDALIEGKRPKADVLWFRGRVLHELGEHEAALADLEAFLERAGKRAAWRAEAEALASKLRER